MANDDDNTNNNDDNHDDDDYQEEEMKSGVGGSRWNPTKEQIEMLERIYSHEGVRTPSADQIQQITARLRVYGHIEGKNVFYWFQNHKARQRQKQRLERLSAAANAHAHAHVHANSAAAAANHFSHINRFLAPHHHHYQLPNSTANCGVNLNGTRPIFPASNHHPSYHQHHFLPNPNAVICNPYYQLPQTNLGYSNPPQNHYSAPAPNHDHQVINNRSSNPSISKDRVKIPHASTLSGYCAAMMKSNPSLDHHHYDPNNQGMRTLNLFPVHPTGILEHKIGRNNNIISAKNSAANSCATTSSSSDTNMNDVGDLHHQHPHFIDFFSSESS